MQDRATLEAIARPGYRFLDDSEILYPGDWAHRHGRWCRVEDCQADGLPLLVSVSYINEHYATAFQRPYTPST